MVLSLDSLPLDVNSEGLLAPHSLVCTLCWYALWRSPLAALWHALLACSVAPLHMQ